MRTSTKEDLDQEPVFAAVCDHAVHTARMALALHLTLIDRAISEGDRAQAIGPILDPTLWGKGTGELEQRLKLLRALRRFRADIEELRP